MAETEMYCVIEWIDDMPILDGAECFSAMEDAVKNAELKELKYRMMKPLLADIKVRYTIPRINLIK